MKILHISDTHGCHRRLAGLPAADVLVHSGDFCETGGEREALDFMAWLCDLPYPHKIFICGNHDECLYGATISGLDENVHYLNNSGVEIDGVKFYGVPMFLEDNASGQLQSHIESIPKDVDVLVTHFPPYGILDGDESKHYGSEHLLAALSTIRPKAHLFGHVHIQHGMVELNGTIYSNAAIVCSRYKGLMPPNVVEIL